MPGGVAVTEDSRSVTRFLALKNGVKSRIFLPFSLENLPSEAGLGPVGWKSCLSAAAAMHGPLEADLSSTSLFDCAPREGNLQQRADGGFVVPALPGA